MSRSLSKPHAASHRLERVGELIRHAVADILARGEVRDDAFDRHPLTIPSVRMSPDLKLATILVMPLGGKGAGATVEALDRHKKELRALVARRINLKFAPDLRFALDTSFDAQARMDALLRSPAVARDLKDAGGRGQGMTGDAREDGLSGPKPREGRRRGEPRQKRSSRVEIDGWINLDKPTGVSSTQAVGRLKFLFNAKKAGHAGTLDPLASGVLPVAFGEATKTVPVVQDGAKILPLPRALGRGKRDRRRRRGDRRALRPAPGSGRNRKPPAALRRRHPADAADLLRHPHRRRARLRSRARRRNLRD